MTKALYTEEDVQRALIDITNGKSVHKAWLDWGVLRSTLQDRINSAIS
jgi:hypothetical protein